MTQYLIYIIPVIVVLLVVIIGFAHARKVVAKYKNQPSGGAQGELQADELQPSKPQAGKPVNRGRYEAPGVSQLSNHPLGAVQSVIHGRIRFLAFGLMLIVVAALALWALWFTDIMTEYTETNLIKTAATVIFAGGIVWGLQLISFITYRIKLRRTGFEISSVFGTKAYEYKDAEFYLNHTIEHKNDSDGYRPVVMTAGNYNFVWQCQILFKDGRKPIILKSSRYAWLKVKMQKVLDALYADKTVAK